MSGAEASAHDTLMAEARAGELFLQLLCQFEPRSVLPFLQAHESYRVQAGLLVSEASPGLF